MNKNFFVGLIIVLVLIFGALAFVSSSFFDVTAVTVSGEAKLGESEILRAAGLDKPVNIFAFNSSKAKAEILKDVYVDSVQINRNFVNRTVDVKIKERILSGYVEYQTGTYLYVDDTGRVLEAQSSFAQKLPVITGLKFTSYKVGERLVTDNPDAFGIMVTLAQLINKYQMAQDVVKVDVSDTSDIHLQMGGIDVSFGGIDSADQKMNKLQATIAALQEQFGADVKGLLDASNADKPSGFKLLS